MMIKPPRFTHLRSLGLQPLTSHLRYLVLLPISLLIGCAAGMQTDFSCQQVDGLKGCMSMTDIHTMVDHGMLQADGHQAPSHAVGILDEPIAIGLSPKPLSLSVSHASHGSSPLQPPEARFPNPKRVPETVARIVIFPFIDETDTFHATQVVYTAITPSHWQAPSLWFEPHAQTTDASP